MANVIPNFNDTNSAGNRLTPAVKAEIEVIAQAAVDVGYEPGGPIIPVVQGGTGASTQSGARTNLGATSIGHALFTAVDEAAARAAIGAGTGSGGGVSVVNNNDGTLTLTGAGITDNGDGTITLA